MRRIAEILSIYLTGLIQGLVLISLPAASSIFTDPHFFGFSQSEYGALFIPQVIMCILAALIAPQMSKSFGSKIIFQFGLMLNILAAALMASSQIFIGQPKIAYMIILVSTSAVGLGFGTTLPSINVYAQRFFPNNTSGALSALHTLLGAGTALAPILVVILVKGLGWWMMPVLSLVILIFILIASLILPLNPQQEYKELRKAPLNQSIGGIVFYLFISIVFIYGYCETMFSNWSIIYLSKEQGIDTAEASVALSIFWAMVTIGRLFVTMISLWVKPVLIYVILPFMILLTLALIKSIHSPFMAWVIFGLAGFSCSAFFPLSFAQAQKLFEAIAEKIAGLLMAFYMFGYGAASYGVGKLIEAAHWTLGDIYQNSIYIAVVLAGLVLLLSGKLQESKI